MVKRFEYEDEFFDPVGLNPSNIYFQISLHKCLWKFPLLKDSTLASSGH